MAFSLAACSSEISLKDGVCHFNQQGTDYYVSFMSTDCAHIVATPDTAQLVTKNLVVDEKYELYKDFNIDTDKETITLSTPSLNVVFNKPTGSFHFTDKAGNVILKENSNGSRTFRQHKRGGEDCYEVKQCFLPTADEALYGLGQFQNGVMNYRGDSVMLQQANKDIVNPLLVSTQNYGLLWNNYSSTKFKDDESGYSFTSEVGDASNYYFMKGKNIDGVISEYRNLTGKVPMFGKWVYGFWQSKERYKSFAELEEVVKEYRKRQIPIDNIVQDWEYWGEKSHWNALKFNEKNFGNAAETIKRLHEKYNVHFMLSVWPGFGPKTDIYRDLDSIGALFDEKTWAGYKIFDAYNPQARDIFWSHFKQGLYDKGVDAWWMDASEPSFRDGFTQEGQTGRTLSAGNHYLGTPHRYLNTYSLVMLGDLYQRLRNESDEKRVFIFTRSAFASQQQYATAIWSGDVPASWENMQKQLTAGVNFSMTGIPYWTSDTGGFFTKERGAQYKDALHSDDYKELYSRWFQFGTFTPIQRAHGTNIPREIWQFGKAGTPYYDNQLKYIKLRYQLLPYIYATSYKVTDSNYTMLRGLAMDFSHDKKTYNIDNSYMFGQAFLVRPVFKSHLEEKEVTTYLPQHEGKYWYNYWDGKAYEGGQQHTQPNQLDVLPLYVKAGSIVPLGEVKQYAMQQQDSTLTINVYTGADAEFLWYTDEGDSYRYEKGEFAKVYFNWNETNRTLAISGREGSFEGMPQEVTLHIQLLQPNGETMHKEGVIYKGQQTEIKF